MYHAKIPSTSRFLTLRGLQYHVREWLVGDPAKARTMVLLHGWMDVSASFQFVVDQLQGDWRVVAPDWRGFGLSGKPEGYDTYWFPDYLADLELLLDALGLEQVLLVGHSMGGNVAMLYSGVAPARVARLVNLEGLGLRENHPRQAAGRYRHYIDQIKQGARLKTYASLAEVAQRLQGNNPRLAADQALFLAGHWASEQADGRWAVRADPAHKLPNPVLYRVEEVVGIWRRISAPVLMVVAGDQGERAAFLASEGYQRRLLAVADLRVETVPDAGHMMHHDRPGVIASLLETFLRS